MAGMFRVVVPAGKINWDNDLRFDVDHRVDVDAFDGSWHQFVILRRHDLS